MKTEIDSLLAAAKKRSEAFATLLDAAAREKVCEHHPGTLSRLNPEKSFETFRFVYECDRCRSEKFEKAVWEMQDRVGVPMDVRHASFENYDFSPRETMGPGSAKPEDFLRAATSFTAGEFRNLILAGTIGIGKGHLAASVVNAAIRQKRASPLGKQTGKWITAHRLFATLHEAYSAKQGIAPIIHAYSRYTLLILDEAGMNELPRDGMRNLYDILSARQQLKSPTLLLTNLPSMALKPWLGAPTVDRLRSGGLKYLWGDWPSARATILDKAANLSDF